jgi:hypothetical protein
MASTLDQRIATLAPGGRLVLSQSHGFTIAVERSGDGRTIRTIRESANGFTVIAQESR